MNDTTTRADEPTEPSPESKRAFRTASAEARPRVRRRAWTGWRRRILGLTATLVVLVVAVALVRAVRRPADASEPVARYGAGRIIPAAQRDPAPHLSGPALDGGRLDLASWSGHVIVVNIWGSWCAPCRQEAPDLERVAAETGYLGVRFVGIDVRDNPAQGRAFEESFGIGYPSLDDSDGALVPQFGRYLTPAVPTTYIFDAHGRIAAMFFGRITYQGLETDLVTIAHEKN